MRGHLCNFSRFCFEPYSALRKTVVRGGDMVDLSGLDRDVATICNKAVALPPDQAREVQPLMAELIGSLEQLSAALVAYKEDLK